MNSSIILIRHGQSLGNTDFNYYKLPDVANILSKKGVDQCIELSKKIDKYLDLDYHGRFTTVLASRFQRAQLTAQIVTHHLHLPIQIDSRLNEVRHNLDNVPLERPYEVARRVLSLVQEMPFNLICFTHGMLMGMLDRDNGEVENCEVRKYDRNKFIERLTWLSQVD